MNDEATEPLRLETRALDDLKHTLPLFIYRTIISYFTCDVRQTLDASQRLEQMGSADGDSRW
jgi:hypothetical protein